MVMGDGFRVWVLFVLLILSAGFVSAANNPAGVYCTRLGYVYDVEETSAGQRGICILPDGTNCDEWDFLKGKCGVNYSYCAVKGYELKRVEDGKRCRTASSYDCAFCVLGDGSEREALDLLENDASYGEYVEEREYGVCGDKLCESGGGEDERSCPADCLTTTTISLCGNGVCDVGERGNCPRDCPPGDYMLVLAVLAVLLAVAAYVYHSKKPRWKIGLR
jgi:putative hemolysin